MLRNISQGSGGDGGEIKEPLDMYEDRRPWSSGGWQPAVFADHPLRIPGVILSLTVALLQSFHNTAQTVRAELICHQGF